MLTGIRSTDIFINVSTTKRLVIVGEPGYGKTLLAIQLVLQILQARNKSDSPDKKLPVPVSVAGWDGKEDGPHSAGEALEGGMAPKSIYRKDSHPQAPDIARP